MRYHVLACDYDGTLAHDGRVDQPTLDAMGRLNASGRKLVLVTGRELDELLANFPQVTLFERVVAENGALLYRPDTGEERVLAKPPREEFVQMLRLRGVDRVSTGRVIVATWRPFENTVLQTIRDLGLEMQVIFNKDAVMVLPSGVNKSTGLLAALAEMGYSAHEAVGVGDAENDHAFLSLCECSAAVANALPSLKAEADIVLHSGHGAGVTELIDRMVSNDLADSEARLNRHYLHLGQAPDGHPVQLSSLGSALLIAGPSGSGKSTAAASFLEQLSDHHYQFCFIDPEGNFDKLENAVTIGGPERGPTIEEILKALADPKNSVVVNLVGLSQADRPSYLLALMPRLQEMRARTARPHWLILDEAHRLLPADWQPSLEVLPKNLNRTVYITAHPGQVARAALETVDHLILVGQNPRATLEQFLAPLGQAPPLADIPDLENGEVILWSRQESAGQQVRLNPSRSHKRRHTR